jgi:hypothetical protein
MPENANLTPWPKTLPEWDSLDLLEKKLFIMQADVYGAYLAYADHKIGRVIKAVEDLGERDNNGGQRPLVQRALLWAVRTAHPARGCRRKQGDSIVQERAADGDASKNRFGY